MRRANNNSIVIAPPLLASFMAMFVLLANSQSVLRSCLGRFGLTVSAVLELLFFFQRQLINLLINLFLLYGKVRHIFSSW